MARRQKMFFFTSSVSRVLNRFWKHMTLFLVFSYKLSQPQTSILQTSCNRLHGRWYLKTLVNVVSGRFMTDEITVTNTKCILTGLYLSVMSSSFSQWPRSRFRISNQFHYQVKILSTDFTFNLVVKPTSR